jgi:hypothetical protein
LSESAVINVSLSSSNKQFIYGHRNLALHLNTAYLIPINNVYIVQIIKGKKLGRWREEEEEEEFFNHYNTWKAIIGFPVSFPSALTKR